MLDARLSPFPWLTVQATVLEARRGEVEGGISFPGDDKKWMHVHRYEIRPVDGLTMAFQNQVLYKDSAGVNPAYLLPLVPIFFSQDLSGNRDNAAMQFDFTYASKRSGKIWSAILIDDLNGLSGLVGSSWGNRWALLAGGQILSPWSRFDADLTLEFSLVRPWTFSGGREEAYTFSHYGLPMGTELGPDSRTIHSRIAWRFLRKYEAVAEWSCLQKGLGRQAILGTVHGHDGFHDPLNANLFSNGQTTDWRTGLGVSVNAGISRFATGLTAVRRLQPRQPDATWIEARSEFVADW